MKTVILNDIGGDSKGFNVPSIDETIEGVHSTEIRASKMASNQKNVRLNSFLYQYTTGEVLIPILPTPPTATVERTENVGATEAVERKEEAAFGAAPLLGDFRMSSLQPTPSTVCEKDQCLRESEQYQPVLDIQKHPANLVTPESMTDRENRLGTLPASWLLQNRPVSSNPSPKQSQT